MSLLSRGRLFAAALALPLLAAACTSTSPTTVEVAGTTPAPSAASTAASTGPGAGPSAAVASTGAVPGTGIPSTGASPTGPSGGLASGSSPAITSAPATSPPTSTAVKRPRVTTVPADGADGISPIAPVRVTVQDGTLRSVTMTNPEGKAVKGTMAADRRSWTTAEPLGYARAYTVTSTAAGAAGAKTTTATSFTTLQPADTIYPSFFPGPKLKTVGVGQPMVVIFDKPPLDRVAAEKALSVTTVPAVTGAWYWWDDRTLHYRAKDYWKPGTRITVSAKIYGVDLGGGTYGETDRSTTVTIGPSRIAQVDDATKQMKVFVNGALAKTYPVSLGRNQQITVNGTDISFVTPSGIYVGQEKYAVKQMSSATYGLPVNSSLGYDSKIPLAVRFSNEGIFVHAAPWSVADQGVRNVSHGCINMSPTAGQWFYDNFGYGDILTVKGTSTKLSPTDGYGDWNLSWDQWLRGSALS